MSRLALSAALRFSCVCRSALAALCWKACSARSLVLRPNGSALVLRAERGEATAAAIPRARFVFGGGGVAPRQARACDGPEYRAPRLPLPLSSLAEGNEATRRN